MQAGELTLAIPNADAQRSSQQLDFEQLMAVHRPRVLRTAYRLLASMDDAQDICQEVFLRLLKNLDSLDAPTQAWLFRVTVNLCNDHFRRRRPVEGFEFEPTDRAPNFAQSFEAEMEMEERKRLLTLGLRRLTERERTAIVLRDIEGLPTAEVAAIIGVEEVTVRTQCAAARVKLAKFVRIMANRSIGTAQSETGNAPGKRQEGASETQS